MPPTRNHEQDQDEPEVGDSLAAGDITGDRAFDRVAG
jgi:hypothetical protein